MAALQAADLVLLNGAGYEGWLNFVSLREERLVNTTAGLADRLLLLEEAVVHQHGPEGEHSHAGNAFTTWLDPTLAAVQALAIERALASLHYAAALAPPIAILLDIAENHIDVARVLAQQQALELERVLGMTGIAHLADAIHALVGVDADQDVVILGGYAGNP